MSLSKTFICMHEKTHITNHTAMPTRSPLEMPRHGISEEGIPLRKKQRSWGYIFRTLFARLFVLGITVSLSVYGVSEMYGVLSTNIVTGLQWLFLVLFSVNFIWIAFAFSQALLGFMVRIKPRLIRAKQMDPNFSTAILIPVYNEEPYRVRAAIEVMRAELLQKAPGKFAFFILSDTNRAEAWVREEAAFLDIVNGNLKQCPVYYRRRQDNRERKAGNIADWVQNWGGAYEAMLVLDADSIMSGDSLLCLSSRLAAAPGVGLIQSLPTIVRAQTLYGRLQQFANQCFGPIYAEGLSAWHGLSSNFWGHNAIIRTKAFAESCSLPIIKGKPPFGGHVLSHDFIEAAMLRRSGWGVRFDTDIKHSYEEAPPSLVDVLIRDRRWCQGNLQHTPFMFAQGFVLPTRLHIFSGIMSYLSAVFWLLLIIVGLAIAVQATVVRPEYFANPSLFPTWPVFDAERALRLFFVSMALVLAPKAFGWLTSLLHIRRCLQFGGPLLLTLSTLFEVLVSALYAPILMVSQFGVVVAVLRGKDSGWMPQSRDDGALSWSAVARTHFGHTLFGMSLSVIALMLSKQLFLWLLPITAGLMLSIPLSWLSGGINRSRLINRLGMLRVPDEKKPASILDRLQHTTENMAADENGSALRLLLAKPDLMQWHLAQLPPQEDEPAEFHAPTVTAEWKVRHAHSLDNLDAMLEPDECIALLNNRECLDLLKSVNQS